jgi:hypothetical protein
MPGLTIKVLPGLLFLAAMALRSSVKVIVLTIIADPAPIWEIKLVFIFHLRLCLDLKLFILTRIVKLAQFKCNLLLKIC